MLWILLSIYAGITIAICVYILGDKEQPYEGFAEHVIYPIMGLFISMFWPIYLIMGLICVIWRIFESDQKKTSMQFDIRE